MRATFPDRSTLSKECVDWIEAEYRHEITDSLRYNIFDIGHLLLRNDPKGYRDAAWRESVSMLFDDAKDFPDFFQRLDYLDALLQNMKAALDTDQHDQYMFLLHRRLHGANSRFADRLTLNGRRMGLPEFSWRTLCAKDEYYTFSVNYRDRCYYKDGLLVRERDQSQTPEAA